MKRVTVLTVLRVLGGVFAAVILGWTVVDATQEFAGSGIRVKTLPALVAIAFLLAAFAMAIAIWRALLLGVRAAVPYRDCLQLWSFSNLGRYLPGKVWQVVGAMVVASDLGVSRAAAGTAAILAVGYQVASGAVFALPLLPRLPTVLQAFALPIVIAAIAAMVPLVFPTSLNLVLRKLGAWLPESDAPISITRARAAGWLGMLLAYWLLQGLGFVFLGLALGNDVGSSWPRWIGTWAMAYVTGLLALFAPGGIGVREGVLAVLLQQTGLVDGTGSVVAVASRLWSIAAEALVLAVALVLRARSGRS